MKSHLLATFMSVAVLVRLGEAKSLFSFAAHRADSSYTVIPLKIFSSYKLILVTNVASEANCSIQHYKELEYLHTEYEYRGLQILGFPCNQFDEKEPGSNSRIQKFIGELNINFPVFAKTMVVGKQAHPLFAWLQSSDVTNHTVEWNWEKFLFKNGAPISRYNFTVSPKQIETEIRLLLGLAPKRRTQNDESVEDEIDKNAGIVVEDEEKEPVYSKKSEDGAQESGQTSQQTVSGQGTSPSKPKQGQENGTNTKHSSTRQVEEGSIKGKKPNKEDELQRNQNGRRLNGHTDNGGTPPNNPTNVRDTGNKDNSQTGKPKTPSTTKKNRAMNAEKLERAAEQVTDSGDEDLKRGPKRQTEASTIEAAPTEEKQYHLNTEENSGEIDESGNEDKTYEVSESDHIQLEGEL